MWSSPLPLLLSGDLYSTPLLTQLTLRSLPSAIQTPPGVNLIHYSVTLFDACCPAAYPSQVTNHISSNSLQIAFLQINLLKTWCVHITLTNCLGTSSRPHTVVHLGNYALSHILHMLPCLLLLHSNVLCKLRYFWHMYLSIYLSLLTVAVFQNLGMCMWPANVTYLSKRTQML